MSMAEENAEEMALDQLSTAFKDYLSLARQALVSMSESIRHSQGQQADLTDTIENLKHVVQQHVDVLPGVGEQFAVSMTESLENSEKQQRELAAAIEQFRTIVDSQSQVVHDVRNHAESNAELQNSIEKMNHLLEKIAENDRAEPNRELKLRIIGPTSSRAA